MFKRFLKVVVASVVSLQSVAVAQVPTAIPTVLPNDASKLQNWYHQIGATQAWKITTGNRKPIVAILSTGVDITHPDLSSNIFVNGHEIPNNGVDEDRNGFIDDVKGVNVVNNSGDVQDSFGGGTYVAGLIGARGNNKIGIPGVNWAVRMMPVKIVDDKGYTTINTVVRGIRYVIAMKKKGHNIKVMYISSLNAPGVFDNYRDALIDAAAAGIVTVTSAGSKPIDNDSSAEVPLPARFKLPSVVSVGSVDNGSLITEFSPIGTSTVHLFAPSMQILSTIPGGKVDVFTTHLAPAGFVAGAMALLSSVEPDLSPAEAIERLLASGTPKIDLEGASMSGRVLNLNNLLLKRTEQLPEPDLSCAYSVKEIEFQNHPLLDAEERVLPAGGDTIDLDKTQMLKFQFPFQGRKFDHVFIGRDGVLNFTSSYHSERPQPFSSPNSDSIAALRTPFLLSGIDQESGVRVRSTFTSIEIQYALRLKNAPQAGVVKVDAILRSSGRIELHLTIPSAEAAAELAKESLIGLRGKSVLSSLIVSRNGSGIPLTGNVAFQMDPNSACKIDSTPTPIPTPVPEVEAKKLTIVGPNGINSIETRRTFRVKITGRGTGSVFPLVCLRGAGCSELLNPIQLTNGKAEIEVAMPKIGKKFDKLSIFIKPGISFSNLYLIGGEKYTEGGAASAKSALSRTSSAFNRAKVIE